CAERIGWNRAVVIPLARHCFDQLFLEAPRRLEIADAALVLAKVRELAGLGDRFRHPTETVDQTDLVRRAAVPDAPLRDLIDLSRRLVPRGRDNAEEARIHRLDPRLDQLVGFGRRTLEQVGLARQRRRLHAVRATAELLY